ncbi:MAG: aspartyl/glutamyl-tRNA amidotransferase subunit A, aspartyl-tRNA(Asn)/glutamyl-tRNA (Gln) amidotransferase subunit A [Candidatus Wolfebacteria bacterium GW2011_GWC1_43_10]|uniref:Glutamyl-tRNA(Gln) amidotransferase subunit A n=2 Tax=Candidatus Wolfeibacteriota TaxID=1752735 RepID=A0A0G1F7V6_9BACT|nr:MAG: aspartyl/glutamyl-tRNA amidotransferase subunit A, aspartyl-tRNA(Asn)/glutamyl-tRNA (Gln) amidotransferase subunit A [Candidatus Wolfebacteria bacterium GW2011_GWC1_43_10]KKT22430.1 MAG: Glutamyl-tRNA(Gln) amidotransferase subunit A [Parcubacteria group bacterium GW2011_GWB1_43_8b]
MIAIKMFTRNFTIKDYRQGLVGKKFSVAEAIGVFFDFLKKEDDKLGAFLAVLEGDGKEKAKELDKKLSQTNPEELSPLFGVPMAIKDNVLISGFGTTAASKILEDYVASYDATVIRKLKGADVVFLGKTNLDEFAMGASTEYSAFKQTRNPYDLSRVPGGSSGGSAVAVAANMALGALGSDTGGSIRQPAGFCGVVGLKPTYGAVSRYGVIALASSLDQVGPFAKTVADAALIFRTIAGQDKFDATSADVDWIAVDEYRPEEAKKLKIGVPKEYFIEGIEPEVKKAVLGAIDKFKKDGFEIKEISLPHTKYAVSCYYIILPAEASANLARYDGIRYSPVAGIDKEKTSLWDYYLKQRSKGIGDEPTRRILLGTFVLSSGYYDAYYAKAQKVRRLILEDFEKVFEKGDRGVDVILAPVSPTKAFAIGSKSDDPLSMYLADIFTIPANLAGLCALSLPAADPKTFNKENLPVNFQIIGRHFEERNILGLGRYFEEELRS